MKREATTLPEAIARLARMLGVPVPHAVGTLSCSGTLPGAYAGRRCLANISDEEIAAAAVWDRDSAELIEALVACLLALT